MDEHDTELLRLAGKTVNMPEQVIGAKPGRYWITGINKSYAQWNPLVNDGDALRLAVDLGMINPGCFPSSSQHIDLDNPDWHAATRRAIVVAAAQIGASM